MASNPGYAGPTHPWDIGCREASALALPWTPVAPIETRASLASSMAP
jgi:hypothetical protein